MKQISFSSCRSVLVTGVTFLLRLDPPLDEPNETAKNEIENQVDMNTSEYHTAPGKEGAVKPLVSIPQPPDPDLNPSPMSATPCPTSEETTKHILLPTSIVAQPTPKESEKWPPDSASGAGYGLAVGGNPTFDTERETIPESLKTFSGIEEASYFGLRKDDNFPLRGTLDLPPLTPEFQRMNSGEKPFMHLPSPDKNLPMLFPLPLETTVAEKEFSVDSGCASMQINP